MADEAKEPRRLFRTEAEVEDPANIDRPTGVTSVAQGKQSWWKWLIGYNDTEALRIGVPIVSTSDWLFSNANNPGAKVTTYFRNLFPFLNWIGSYNLTWASGDLIAGITVALVVVPQSMSYAQLALLSPEFGLYSSFVGVMIYALFATSKDVTIGPVAVMSLQTANVVTTVLAKVPAGTYTNEQIASALAFLCGIICLGIGLLRLGWIVEFIPAPAVAGFMSGSAVSIAVGQVPKLMGITGVTTNGVPTYQIAINTLKGLSRTKIDAAFGLSALAFLYLVRSACVHLPRRYPKLARPLFFVSVFRNAFTIIVLLVAARLWCGQAKYAAKKNYPISILKTVPAGFQHIGTPVLDTSLLSDMASELPVSVIVLLLEHIAISKSFGRLNNYKINPNQELIAIGTTNLIGPCFGGYAATGSFSRSAIKSKSGVRTPLAGWVTGILVVIAIYALTGTFYWIPNAALSAVIIHAVGDLITSPRTLYKFWLVNPLELVIFLAAVFVSVFVTLEVGVYVSVAASAVLLLVRIAHPRGRWLGRVRIHHGASPTSTIHNDSARDVYVPLDDKDGLRDPSIHVEPPPPGVFIYRFEEAFTYPNCSHLADLILDHAKEHTRPGKPLALGKPGDRPWNDPGPINPMLGKLIRPFTFGAAKRGLESKLDQALHVPEDNRPFLRAFVLDFSGVSNVDTTSIQTLVDVRNALERWADGPVEFHFANILSPWIRRALLAGGFGTGHTWGTVTEVAPVVPNRLGTTKEEDAIRQIEAHARNTRLQNTRGGEDSDDIDQVDILGNRPEHSSSASSQSDNKDRLAEEGGLEDSASVNSVPILWAQDLTPFFHLDLSSAVASATAAVGAKNSGRHY